jgi:hypothetical protein
LCGGVLDPERFAANPKGWLDKVAPIILAFSNAASEARLPLLPAVPIWRKHCSSSVSARQQRSVSDGKRAS